MPSHDTPWYATHNTLADETRRLINQTGAHPVTTAAGTLVPYRSANTLLVPYLCDLRDTTVDDAVDTAKTLITTLSLAPANSKRLFRTYDKLAAWSRGPAVPRLTDVVDGVAVDLICAWPAYPPWRNSPAVAAAAGAGLVPPASPPPTSSWPSEGVAHTRSATP